MGGSIVTDSIEGWVFPTDMASEPELKPPKPSSTSTEQVIISNRGALSEVRVRTFELDKILSDESVHV